MKKTLFFVSILISISLTAQNLPHYKLTIAPANLDSMNAHPKDEIYYPAVFHVNSLIYNVQARFKGSTSLNYPKKSWAIKFENADNYFGVTRINLHADFKDYSNMRNFLILRLFDFLGSPASQIQHVTCEVNGEPYGIYTQTEQIDIDYLARNGRLPVALYKANNHGAMMAPTVRDEYYNSIWQIEAGGDPSFDELRIFFNKCLYWSKPDFDTHISDLIDVDNFLNFFAVHFVFDDMDNFTKNIYLNKNSNNQKFELLPWDNEGSFGNSAIGVFDSTIVQYNLRDAHTPEYQVVFQRLLENQNYRTIFHNKIERILTDGYSMLDTLIDNTYQKIKQDVYADSRREASNEDFDNSIPRLKWFMSERKLFLQNNALPEKNVLTNFYCSNPMPTAGNSEMTFQIKSPVVQDVNMFFADSVDLNVFGVPFKFSRMQLYDDGLHNDSLANDLIYGNSINVSSFVSPLIPFAITGAEQNYPPNGIFYVDYYGSKSYAINKGNTDADLAGRLKIGKVFNYKNQNAVEIINTSSTLSVDLSYCHLRSDSVVNDFMFRDHVVIAPNETIFVVPSVTIGNQFFPGYRSFADLYYPLAVGDSLHLLSPVLTPVVSSKINSVETLGFSAPVLVINEINFKSSNSKPTGDWVEIYNPGTSAVDMSGWIFRDGDNKHTFLFPTGYSLPVDGYVVVAEDTLAFHAAAPEVSNVVGSTGFGLSSTGEFVRLFDNLGQLVDSVNYQVVAPWPTGASGTGATLELKDFALDNTDGNSWYVDPLKTGSPGAKNFVTPVEAGLNNIHSGTIYPNPAHRNFFVETTSINTRVELYTIQGELILSQMIYFPGTDQIDIRPFPKGIYLIHLSTNKKMKIRKLIVQ